MPSIRDVAHVGTIVVPILNLGLAGCSSPAQTASGSTGLESTITVSMDPLSAHHLETRLMDITQEHTIVPTAHILRQPERWALRMSMKRVDNSGDQVYPSSRAL